MKKADNALLTKIIKIQPDEVRIYPDGSVFEVYGNVERLVINPILSERYKSMLREEEMAKLKINSKLKEKNDHLTRKC